MKNVYFGKGADSTPIQTINIGDKIFDGDMRDFNYLALSKGYAVAMTRNRGEMDIVKDTMGRIQHIYLSREDIIALYNFVMMKEDI